MKPKIIRISILLALILFIITALFLDLKHSGNLKTAKALQIVFASRADGEKAYRITVSDSEKEQIITALSSAQRNENSFCTSGTVYIVVDGWFGTANYFLAGDGCPILRRGKNEYGTDYVSDEKAMQAIQQIVAKYLPQPEHTGNVQTAIETVASDESGYLIGKNDFEPYRNLTIEDALKRYGITVNGEKTIEDIQPVSEVRENGETYEYVYLYYDGFYLRFSPKDRDDENIEWMFNYLMVEESQEPFIHTLKIGSSENEVLTAFRNDNETVKQQLVNGKPVVALLDGVDSDGYQRILLYDGVTDSCPYSAQIHQNMYQEQTPNQYTAHYLTYVNDYAAYVELMVTFTDGFVSCYRVAFT